MITNFEEYTDQLTDDEKNFIIPVLIKSLSLAIGKERAITNNDFLKQVSPLTVIDDNMNVRYITTSAGRVRHMIHALRVSDTIPYLVATSKGYYISNDIEEIKTYIDSLDDRLRHIAKLRKSIIRQLKNHPNNVTYYQQRIIM